MRGEPCTIFGDGLQTRAFTHVEDVAPTIARSIENPRALNEVFNLGSDAPTSVLKLASFIQQVTGRSTGIVHLPPRVEVVHAVADHAKARDVLGHRAAIPLSDGVCRMIVGLRQVDDRTPEPNAAGRSLPKPAARLASVAFILMGAVALVWTPHVSRLDVSVVMPAYNEAAFIASAVREFLAVPEVDEVLVVDNNSSDETGALALAAGARVVTETVQGYGAACRRALADASGDLVLLVEPDGTFVSGDVAKFLAYAREFDAVLGTRTSKSAIWAGANMWWFLRYGNVAVAKLLEYLHNGPCLTDVGCTFKLFHRDAVRQMAPYLTASASHFSPELMLVSIRTGLRCIEIPVHYRGRVGESKITGSFVRAWRLGWRMIAMIVAYRFRSLPRLTSCIGPSVLTEIGEHA